MTNQAQGQGEILTGVFYDSPVEGLEYWTQTQSGLTSDKAEFTYREGETVNFLVGGVVIGAAIGKSLMTPADLVVEVGGQMKRLKQDKVINIARFLQSLNKDDNIEEKITITEQIRNTVAKYRYDILFEQSPEAFGEQVTPLFAELQSRLRTPAEAKNHLRRTLYGIRKTTDVKIPMRDGAYVMANIFRPIQEGKYPVIISFGAYGKAFGDGRICNEEDRLAKEVTEDCYFEGTPEPSPFMSGVLPWENGEAVNTVDWVPRGYAVARVDERGSGNSPGFFEQFSLQEARDFYDSIEWLAKQPWCNGNVGIWGAGYFAMDAWNVAGLQPPSLKAMIPVGGDSSSYRDYAFTGGGLWNTFNGVMKNTCGEWQGVEWVEEAMKNTFDEPEIWGPEGRLCISPVLENITVPFYSGMGLAGTLHNRGLSEAFIRTSSKHKKMTMISETGIHFWAYTPQFLEKHIAFFDYFLKGIDNGIMDEPPIQMMVRTGWGGYYWQDEYEWPLARTQYTKLYLDASPSGWAGDGKRNDFLKLGPAVPQAEQSSTYNADVEWNVDTCWQHGVSFVTEPMAEDTLLAGYMKLAVWVSSTTHDMELHASVRVMDENNREIHYPLGKFDEGGLMYFPVGFGGLKVSHRKLDPKLSTIYRPYHTHKKADYQPLNPGEPVEAEVELWPSTALIRKGWRLRLDVGPVSGSGIGLRIHDTADQSYQKGSSNTVYTGPDHPSYLQIPVVPPRS
jgi:predicted acyl esterase